VGPISETYSHIYKILLGTRTSSLPKRGVARGSMLCGVADDTIILYTIIQKVDCRTLPNVIRRVHKILLYYCCCVNNLSDYETKPLQRPKLPVLRSGVEIRGLSIPVQSPVLIFRLVAKLSERKTANER